MCGFSVAIFINKKQNTTFSDVKKMNALIGHRGPDQESYFENKKIFKDKKIKFSMGFRRLKIIDLSSKAQQPFFFLKRYIIVFNGEIYNYLEIKRELIKKKINFKTSSDTEVVLAAYHFYGKKCFQRFNGMWSLIIYDRLKKEFVISRDRYGVKPLYYYINNKKFYFSSEIKQLLFLLKSRKVNIKKLQSFFGQDDFSKSNETFFQGINKLEPGSLIILNESNFAKKKWYTFKKKKIKKHIKIKLYDNLLRAVRLRLRADVKIGISFSGGIDSSAIASLVAVEEKNIINKIQTYSVTSEDKNDERFYINSFNKKYLYKNYLIKLSFKKFLLDLDKIVWAHDEPIANLSVISEWQLFSFMKKKKVKVNLDGHGADEIFCGYEKYFSLYLKNNIIRMNFFKIIFFVYTLLTKNINNKLSFAFRILINLLPKFIINKLKINLNNDFKSEWLLISHKHSDNTLTKEKISNDLILNENYKQFFHSSLPEQLQWSDRNSMFHSIETRSPFLDPKIVESFLLLNSEYKIHGITSKYILRESLKEILPRKIYDRNFKVGFSAPEQQWLKLNKKSIAKNFNQSFNFLQKILSPECKLKGMRIIEGNEKYNIWIWKVIFLGRWFKKFKVII